MRRESLIFAFLMIVWIVPAQTEQVKRLYDGHGKYKESQIKNKRFKSSDVQRLIQQLSKNSLFTVEKVGESIEGRPLSLIKMGDGETKVLLWSQMHGNESTATMALFDIFNFFMHEKEMDGFKREILDNLTVYVLPMLNPDGADLFQRHNMLGIDINRDAEMLQSPESQTLKGLVMRLQPQFGFNLHDQSRYYSVGNSNKTATISFLAPAYNYEKSINEVRGNAMRLIGGMTKVLNNYIPGHVAKYSDAFEPRAFGDNVQKWGTSTILIESGGYADDPEKQYIRRLNYVAILSALSMIANKDYESQSFDMYNSLPFNSRSFCDLKIEGLTYLSDGKAYTLDVAINLLEKGDEEGFSYFPSGTITEQGDLRTRYGYNTFSAAGLTYQSGKTYPKVITTSAQLEQLDMDRLIKEGYLYVTVSSKVLSTVRLTDYPLILQREGVRSYHDLKPGSSANFLLVDKHGQVQNAVVRGAIQAVK